MHPFSFFVQDYEKQKVPETDNMCYWCRLEPWAHPRTKCTEKDSLKKVFNEHSSQGYNWFITEINLGAKKYIEEVPNVKGLTGMHLDDNKTLFIKFNTTYLLTKKETPFSDYPDLLELQKKNGIQNIGKVYLTDPKCAIQHIKN